MNELLIKYLNAFKKLRIDRAHGVAPHKPILLLSVLQSFSNKIFNSEKIYITPELVALFNANWNLLVTTNHDCRFALPFCHLTSDKFWKLKPKLGFESILLLKPSMRSFANLNLAIDYATINNELLQLMLDESSNKFLQQSLLDEYFPNTKDKFDNSLIEQNKVFDIIEDKILNESPLVYQAEIKKLINQNNEEELFLRSLLFKREIIKLYNGTCCISGMKIDAVINIAMVDACHIIPFSQSYDDTITNGICLCPNLHRAFDRGLLTINENFTVIVSHKFTENESMYSLRAFGGKQIKRPVINDFNPFINNLLWHKNNVFKEF